MAGAPPFKTLLTAPVAAAITAVAPAFDAAVAGAALLGLGDYQQRLIPLG